MLEFSTADIAVLEFATADIAVLEFATADIAVLEFSTADIADNVDNVSFLSIPYTLPSALPMCLLAVVKYSNASPLSSKSFIETTVVSYSL